MKLPNLVWIVAGDVFWKLPKTGMSYTIRKREFNNSNSATYVWIYGIMREIWSFYRKLPGMESLCTGDSGKDSWHHLKHCVAYFWNSSRSTGSTFILKGGILLGILKILSKCNVSGIFLTAEWTLLLYANSVRGSWLNLPSHLVSDSWRPGGRPLSLASHTPCSHQFVGGRRWKGFDRGWKGCGRS